MDAELGKNVALAERILGDLIAVKPGERVIIVADESGMATNGMLAYSLLAGASRRGVEATLTTIQDRVPGTETLSDAVNFAVEGADVLIGLTLTTGAAIRTKPVSKRFLDKQLRMFSLMKRTWEHWERPSVRLTDYGAVAATGRAVAEVLSATSEVHLTCDRGSDFRVSLAGCHFGVTAAECKEPGQLGVLPDGECYTVPVEGTAQGRLVVDGPVTHFGRPANPVTLDIVDNFVTAVEGDDDVADALRRVVTDVENGGNVCEFAIGTNPDCVVDADIQEVKKGAGRVHVAIGSNIGSTVRSPVHIDMVVMKPSAWADGQQLIDHGQLLVGSGVSR
jgi:leucyl aminopeptidase (aminopeptidase T)